MTITTYTKKDGSTVYRTSVYLGIDQVTGKKIKTTISARTKRELANRKLEAIITFKQTGQTREKVTTVTTYKELTELWWTSWENTVKPNTQENTRSLLDKHLLPLFGDYRLDKLTPSLIQGIVNDLATKTNKGEIGAYLHYDKIHGLNKRILQYGVILQALPYNPAREVILPRNTKRQERCKIKHWEREEVRAFNDYLAKLDQTNYKNLYDATLYNFLLATGCRISEALALDWSDIDLDGQTVTISKTVNCKRELNSPKSQSSHRLLDLDANTVQQLRRYRLAQRKEELKLGQVETVVFSDFINPYPNHQSLAFRLRLTHCKTAGVPYIGFHGFRHTHASLLLNAGIPYKELQDRLGHSKIAITLDTYGHLFKDKTRTAVTFFEKAVQDL